MATNADETVVDDDKPVTEEDLRQAKYGADDVEDSKESDETDDTAEADEESEEASEESEEEQSEEETSFVKEFPHIKGDTYEEYSRNLEQAYQNSTAEAMRLKALADAAQSKDETDDAKIDTSDPLSLYMKQKMDEEINSAYSSFAKQYSQVADPTEYDKFVKTVSTMSNTILQSEGRMAAPGELYSKAAVILGWESVNAISKEDKLKSALKDSAANSKTSSSTKTTPKSKVTDQMVAINRMMYPGKTDAEIREELEPYVK